MGSGKTMHPPVHAVPRYSMAGIAEEALDGHGQQQAKEERRRDTVQIRLSGLEKSKIGVLHARRQLPEIDFACASAPCQVAADRGKGRAEQLRRLERARRDV